MWNLKYGTNEPIYKTETDSWIQRINLWLPRGMEGGRWMDWVFGASRCKLFIIQRMDEQQALLYSTGK